MYFTVVCNLSSVADVADKDNIITSINSMIQGLYETLTEGDDYIVMFNNEHDRNKNYHKIKRYFGETIDYSIGIHQNSFTANDDGEDYL